MKKLLERLKPRLNENEYSALEKACKEITEPHVPSFYDVCFTCRYDTSLAYVIVNTLRKNITDARSLFEYVASIKTLYLTDRNNRQQKECAYSEEGDLLLLKQALLTATANAHLLIAGANSDDVLTLCKAAKCFDDLRFFASETKTEKTVYENLRAKTACAISNADIPTAKKLINFYLSTLPLEDADCVADGFEEIFSAIKRTKKDTAEIVFLSEKGLDVYGYCERCENLRSWAIDRFMQNDKRFSAAIISEIVINN